MCSKGLNCELLEYDDSHCTDIAKCCVGVHDQGDHGKCTSAARKCRNFGTTWDPRRPMKPLPFDYMYNDAPGYATTGAFVKENFGDWNANSLLELFDPKCMLKNAVYGAILTSVLYYVAKKKMVMNDILTISIVAAVLKCVLNAL